MKKLIAIPAFKDNYVWMIHDGREALVVDPGDAAPVQRTLKELGLRLTAILVTHHHADHIGGIPALREEGVVVHGLPDPAVPDLDVHHHEGDRFDWQGLSFDVMSTPGHTHVHASYLLAQGLDAQDTAPIVFVGDTLFSGGCGRVFDGSIDQLHDSLQKLSALPTATRVCAAHEYTLANLRFAQAVEPDNPALADYVSRCEHTRAQGLATLPTTIGQEQRVNPFLRLSVATVCASARAHGASSDSPSDVFAALRAWKNVF